MSAVPGPADESGLVFMRARYYEPSSGRFVSEDLARHGINWFSYASCDPVNLADQSGNAPNLILMLEGVLADLGGFIAILIGFAMMTVITGNVAQIFGAIIVALVSFIQGASSAQDVFTKGCRPRLQSG